MRTRFTILIAGLALATTMWAQAGSTPVPAERAKHARGPERMFQALNLTDDQKAKVQTILQGERSQIQALRNNTSLTDEQKKQQIRELRKNDHQQLLAVLTPEQQAKMKELRQGKEGRGGFHAGRRFQGLNLTEQQKAQLQPVFQATRQQLQALRSDTTLTPEQKHEKMREIRQNQMAQMKSILTPEQQQQWQQMRGRHRHKGGAQNSTPPSA